MSLLFNPTNFTAPNAAIIFACLACSIVQTFTIIVLPPAGVFPSQSLTLLRHYVNLVTLFK